MKKFAKVLSVLALLSATAASTAFSQLFTVQVDEFGNGFLNGIAPIPYVYGPNPASGLADVPVLTYTLSFPAAPGDVRIFEPSSAVLSDLVRFTGNSQMIFMSNGSDTIDFLADVPAFPTLISPVADVFEQGSEGNHYAQYLADNGMPGFDGQGLYLFISDVPEPGSPLLAALGGGLTLLTLWRRQQSRIRCSS